MRFAGAITVATIVLGAAWSGDAPDKLLILTGGILLIAYGAGWFDAWGWLQSKLEPPE